MDPYVKAHPLYEQSDVGTSKEDANPRASPLMVDAESHLMPQVEVEAIYHAQQKLKIAVVDDIGDVPATCEGVSKETVNIPKHRGTEEGGLGPTRVITAVGA